MPLYEYQCRACGHRFEKIQKFSDPPIAECPSCGGEVEKLLSAPAIQFKGAGWYITDYARKGAGETSSSPAASSGDSSGSKGDAAKDGKSDKTSSDSKKASAPAADSSASKPAKTD